ncbi:WhiB family transcriptional regulator [Mycobacterium sp. PSTR-4-N]|uniref:WhiB family transcriptional regulator n=1 Tax=Mycobacterium sp. PSTR-4-N TaxID=2917745 RepID=UPI001F151A20|nr:WhiB family transcriptional regulator [Mycobacterium sp. PSTR-4-N]MCG7592441.1 WhiB family transcriptional regulator [Mycobacterium sp. PSTR-4-N]
MMTVPCAADPTKFFAERGGSAMAAKRICGTCPVQQQCLDHALLHNEKFGIWGGTSPKERRRMQLGQTAPPAEYNPADYTRADGHGFRGYKRGCTCQVCRTGYARYQRDYKRRSGISVQRFCVQCGMLLKGSGRTKYCGGDCRTIAKMSRLGDAAVTQLPRGKHQHECAWCAAPFESPTRRAQYCTPRCRIKAHNARKKVEKAA